MTPTPKIAYSPEDIAARFTVWAALPTNNDRAIMARNVAWCHYCDARDGLPEGTSQSRSLFSRMSHDEENHQLRMFS